jgi:hypothetical protein
MKGMEGDGIEQQFERGTIYSISESNGARLTLAFSGRRGETGGGRRGAVSKVDREQKGTAEAKGTGGE